MKLAAHLSTRTLVDMLRYLKNHNYPPALVEALKLEAFDRILETL